MATSSFLGFRTYGFLTLMATFRQNLRWTLDVSILLRFTVILSRSLLGCAISFGHHVQDGLLGQGVDGLNSFRSLRLRATGKSRRQIFITCVYSDAIAFLTPHIHNSQSSRRFIEVVEQSKMCTSQAFPFSSTCVTRFGQDENSNYAFL